MTQQIETQSNQTMSADGHMLIPVLPLRDVVVYPHMVIPLFVGREKSIRALDLAMQGSKLVVLIAQRSAEIDDPGPSEIYTVGTMSNVLQLLRLPDGTVKVLVEGTQRVCIHQFTEITPYFVAEVSPLEYLPDTSTPQEILALSRSLINTFEQYVRLNKKIPNEVLTPIANIEDADRLTDTIAAHMTLKLSEKQKILEMQELCKRLEYLLGLIENEIDILQVEKKVRNRVKQQMEKSQREYYLNEQMKAIQKELGDLEEVPNEIEELTLRVEKAGMPKLAKNKAKAELHKLKMMSPMSAEATVVRNYIDWLANIPWKKYTRVCKNLAAAEKILELDHYGLDKVKERILEYLAVQQRARKMKGPVLCLVGPPGVGKTSLGRSIARATNRKFVKMSLGGVRDEAEIRGHRRTYIGSLPGKIIQNLVKVEVRNPLFLFDEIDKMSMDFRGDPSSALLEVLDPEQNDTFNDHYLEVDFNLSDIMFVATANTLHIPHPLLDRMEVIRIPGYTEEEKLGIATRYLMPKQLRNHGLKKSELEILESSIFDIIRFYTREAGVRNLERELAKICRKVVKEITLNPMTHQTIVTPDLLEKYLGIRRFRYGLAEEIDQVGQVAGLAWTEVGGELLRIEAALVPGKGKLIHTGQLGEVMRESIQAALTVVRSRADVLGIRSDFHQKSDIHIHVPEGATPKDGPSAGIGMCTALVSTLTNIPVRANVAMTGEITLRGEVLPIGGLKEKLLAAHRGTIAIVVIPEANRKDLADIPEHLIAKLDIRPVRWIDQVLEIALQHLPSTLLESVTATATDNNLLKTNIRAH